MNPNEKYFRETELRKVDPRDVHALAEKLDLTCDGDGGKALMGIIPKDQDQTALKYKQSDIFHTQQAAENSGGKRLFTEILFDEWGSSGCKRPNIGLLLELLVEAELWQGADYVAEAWLNELPPARPSIGPAASISPFLIEKEINPLRTRLFDSSNYPETDEINFNANNLPDSMAMGNNLNRFVKYQGTEKKIFDHSDSTAVTAETPKPPSRPRAGRRQQQEQQVGQQSDNDVGKDSESENALQSQYQENQHHEHFSTTTEHFRSDFDSFALSCLLRDSTNTETTNLSATSSIPPTNTEPTISMLKPQFQENHHEQFPTTSKHFDSDLDTSNLPKFSSLMPKSANTESTCLGEASCTLPMNREQTISMSNSKEITSATSDRKSTATDEATDNYTTEIFPNLPLISALNANSKQDTNAISSPMNCVEVTERRNSGNSSSSNNSSHDPNDENLIEMCDLTGSNEEQEEEDMYDNDSPLPDLSILDQQSSNNDSSLTTVTGTSGSNSFEHSTNDSNSGSGSESGNIPC